MCFNNLLKKARKMLKNVFIFLYGRFEPRYLLVIYLHVSSKVLCSKLKTRSLGFLIQMEASEIQTGLFTVADEISKERPRRLIKVVAGKKEKRKK